jgi:hypothetical protein
MGCGSSKEAVNVSNPTTVNPKTVVKNSNGEVKSEITVVPENTGKAEINDQHGEKDHQKQIESDIKVINKDPVHILHYSEI